MVENKNEKEFYISEKESNRITILRGILTLMVVNIHSMNIVVHFKSGNVILENSFWLESFEFLFSEVISRVAVPLFFFISSILLYRKDFSWKENAKKKTRSLVIPYFLVNTFWVIVYAILQNIPLFESYFTMEGYIVRYWNLIGWLKCYGVFSSPLVAPLWFIRDLFILNLLSKIIPFILNYAPRLFFCIIIIFWISPFTTHIFCLDKQAICFWCLGYLCVYYKIELEKIDEFRNIWIALLYGILVVLNLALKNSEYVWIIHNVCIILGFVFWYAYTSSIKYPMLLNILNKISEYSFGIYLLHELTLNCINKVYAKIFISNSITKLFGYICIPIFIITCCIYICYIMKKYTPRFYCLLLGKKYHVIDK